MAALELLTKDMLVVTHLARHKAAVVAAVLAQPDQTVLGKMVALVEMVFHHP